MEQEVLTFWKEDKIFEESVDKHKDEHVFYDGPPFPTGSPHYGTVFVSILKDAIARFWTMRGKSVPRVWGWDCHGLPIENAVEKQLNISDKRDITQTIGIKQFNDSCRALVSGYNDAWEEYIDRIGRWVDYDHPYRTLDKNYMESVIWVFAESYKKGLIYKDYRVTPYCYHCETSLSISDTRESDSTRPRQDPTVIVKFKSLDSWGTNSNKPTYYLAWTTTPWTLPANLALAVGPDIEYVLLDTAEAQYILAKSLYNPKDFPEDSHIISSFSGRDMEGKKYEPLFPYFAEAKNAFQIILGDHVSTEDGVGIVHTAPAYGEEDYWVSRNYDIEIKNPVLANGTYDSTVVDFIGENVHDANPKVIRKLKEEGKIFKQATVEHNYPHCWRCRTPLIYRAMDAWYYNIEKIKPQLMEENKKINWIPETIKEGRFGKWLEGARDWNLSRNRYWGTPIPVWICEDSQCQHKWIPSSVAELEERSGQHIDDLHIEFIDELEITCECGKPMKRTPEVLDGWFESGAMPFGQCHYPFENKQWFENHFPADFIVEYPGQIRGWFYYLHVLAVGILGRPAFKNCLVHGTLLASDGQKFSKSKKNYTDPIQLLDQYGADALRLYLINSAASVLGDLKFVDGEVRDQVKEIIIPLLNVVSFFTTYANLDGFEATLDWTPESERNLDKWIIALLSKTIKDTTDAYEAYKMNEVLAPSISFIENLSNWYIRRSRELFWESGMSHEKENAYQVLYYCIVQLLKLLAPAMPFLAEKLYKDLTNDKSVHLSDWPEFSFEDKEGLLERYQLMQKVTKLGLSLRQQQKMKVRQPLAELKLCLPDQYGRDSLDFELLKEELNVKHISLLEDYQELARIKAIPNPKLLGPLYGSEVQFIIKNAKAGNVKIDKDHVTVYSEDKTWDLSPDQIQIGYEGKDDLNVLSEDGIVLAFDFELTEELIREGILNDLNRAIQNMRKDAGYNLDDRIYLKLEGSLKDSEKQKLYDNALGEASEDLVWDVSDVIHLGDEDFTISMKKKM